MRSIANFIGMPPAMQPIFIVFWAIMLLLLTGCCAGERAFVEAADRYHDTVGEDWAGYVEQDETLTDAEKQQRLMAHELFGEAIAERGKVVNGGSSN